MFSTNHTVILWLILIMKTCLADIPEFVCTDGTNIKLENVCNGVQDCPDGSDEIKELCYHIICPPNMFRCFYGACVKKSARCDGNFDCADKSDEKRCGKKSGDCELNEFVCNSGECLKLEKICDGTADCKDASDEDALTCEEFPCPTNSFHCKHGGCIHLNSRCDGFPDCVDGSDESDTLCSALKCKGDDCTSLQNKITCSPVTSNRISAKCEVLSGPKKGLISCAKPLPIDTKVSYECKPYYKPSSKRHFNNTQMICQQDGSWNNEVLRCEPECGKRESAATPMVVNGWQSTAGRWPWHATLYVRQEGAWKFWCGGSLISEKVVVTAAHCTWKIIPNNMRVALGKLSKDFETRQVYTQIRDIKNIIIQPTYQDQIGNYGSDIAVLILNETIEFDTYIRPVCVDWEQQEMNRHLKHGTVGMIAGMGITENDTFSNVLREITLPVAENTKCLNEQPVDFRKYVTFTAFCAGWANGSGVCNGDSGGGLVFPKTLDNNVWVLQGIVSVSPRQRSTSFCDPNFYTVFTKVGMYAKWLSAILNNVHPDRLQNREKGPSTENIDIL